MAKKMGRTAAKVLNIKSAGPEPVWSGIANDSQLGDYLNWCNTTYEFSETRQFLMDYLAEQKRDTKLLDALPDDRFGTVGAMARALSYGRFFEPETVTRFNQRVDSLFAMASVAPKEAPRKTVVQYVELKVSDGIVFAERVFDDVMNTNEFNDDHLTLVNNGVITQKVAEAYLPILKKTQDEVDSAISGKDPELAEGYSGWDRSKLKQFAAALEQMQEAIQKIAETTAPKIKKPRKPRVSRPKSPEKQIKKLKYSTGDDKYKVKSVEPRTVIGANEVWLFNSVYRKLTVLRAVDRGGLSIKGSTVYGFDEKNSFSRKLRKPENILPLITSEGKVTARKTFESLTTTMVEAKGRINEDTVILRVFK